MNNFKLNTNTVINGTPVTTVTGDPVQTIKGSELSDGGLLQSTDSIIITRNTGNYKVTGSNIIASASETVQGKIQLATQPETDAGTDDTKAITPLKLATKIANSPLATTTQKGFTQLATATEYFSKDSTKAITSNDISNDVRLASFSAGNSATGLTQVVAIGGSYNVLTPLLEVNEVQTSNIAVVYKTIANATQSKLLNEVNDVIILPSPLYTFNQTYNRYNVFVSCVADIPTIQNDRVVELYIVIRRAVDNVEITRSYPILYTETNAGGGVRTNTVITTGLMPLFVDGEADALCNGGFKIFLENASYSNQDITLKSANVRIFRD